MDIVASCWGLGDSWKGTSFNSVTAISRGMGGSSSSSVSDSEKRHSLVDELDRVRSVKGDKERQVTGEEISEVGGEGPSLFTREVGERHRIGLPSEEVRAAVGELLRIGFTRFRSYTQSDPPSLERGVQGCFALHLCKSSSHRNKRHGSVAEGAEGSPASSC